MNYIVFAIVTSILSLSILPFAVAEHPGHIHFHGGVSASGQNFVSGDIIQFNGWSNAYKDWEGGLILTPSAIFDVRILDPDGKIIFRQNFTADDNGEIRFSFPVTEDFKFGKYLIHFSISKEGYETYSEEHDLNRFYVARTEDDVIPATEYDFKIWAEESEVRFASNVRLRGTLCPSPLELIAAEEFVDPTIGQVVSGQYVLLIYHLTKPDGSTLYQTGSFESSNCMANPIESQFNVAKVGEWSVYAVARWIQDGVIYEVRSNTVKFIVQDTFFRSEEIEPINLRQENWCCFSLLDWSPDGDSVLFKYSFEREPTIQVATLGLMSPDGEVREVDIPVKSDQEDSAKGIDTRISHALFSPSGDNIYILWGSDIYRFNLESKDFVQLTSGGQIIGFDITPNESLIYSVEQRGATPEEITYNLWLTDSNGKRIEKIFTSPDIWAFDLSPDGKKVVYLKTLESGYGYADRILAVYNLETKQVHEVPDIHLNCGMNPRWTPNSELIIYHDEGCGRGWPGGILGVTDTDGRGEILIPSSNDNPQYFVTSPDGRHLLVWFSNAGQSLDLEQGDFHKMTFTHPIPEFPVNLTAITAIGLIGVIIVLRVKSKITLR